MSHLIAPHYMTDSPGIDDPRITDLLNRLVMQAKEHAFVLLDPAGRFLWCSPGAQKLFGVTTAQLVGREFREIFTDQDRAFGLDRLEMAIAESDAVSEDDRWHLRADGTRFWSAGALVKITGSNGELLGFGKVVRDRTDFKTELELRTNQLERMVALDRSRDQAITKWSHELRNVIAGVRGAVEILDKPLDREPVRQKFADLMQRQLGMLERLTEDVLDVKRGEAGKIELKCEPLSLQVELRAIIAALEPRLMERQLDLQLLAPPASVRVNGDPQRLQQVFRNLIENAIKYTPAGGRIWVKLTTEDRYAVTHVEDTGKGIPHNMLRSIFDLFTQVDPQQSSGGLGVGLALVRELVVRHGGTVQAASKGPGQGSEFSVRLPLIASESASGST